IRVMKLRVPAPPGFGEQNRSTAVDSSNQPSGLMGTDRERVLREWNKTSRSLPQVCVHELVEEQACRNPDRAAVVFKNESLTLFQINSRANQLARYLAR